jgi:hypothetical protein
MSKVLRSLEDNISNELLKVTYHVWFKNKSTHLLVTYYLHAKKTM